MRLPTLLREDLLGPVRNIARRVRISAFAASALGALERRPRLAIFCRNGPQPLQGCELCAGGGATSVGAAPASAIKQTIERRARPL